MPAAKSIEWNVEEIVRLKLLTDARLADAELKHHDEPGRARIEYITLRAVKGPVQLEGVGGYEITVYVTFQTSTLSSEAADLLCLAISEAMYKPDPAFAPNLPDLKYVSLEPETSTDRQNTTKFRKRVVTFPFIAKLID